MTSLAIDIFHIVKHISIVYLLGICIVAFITVYVDPTVDPKQFIIQALSETYNSIAEWYTPILVDITALMLLILLIYFLMDVVYFFAKCVYFFVKWWNGDRSGDMMRNIPGPPVVEPSSTTTATDSTPLITKKGPNEIEKSKSLYLRLFSLSLVSLLATFSRLYYEQTKSHPDHEAQSTYDLMLSIGRLLQTMVWDAIPHGIINFVASVLLLLLLYNVALTTVLLFLILLQWLARKCFCCGCLRRRKKISAITSPVVTAETDIETERAEEGVGQYGSQTEAIVHGDYRKGAAGQEYETIAD